MPAPMQEASATLHSGGKNPSSSSSSCCCRRFSLGLFYSCFLALAGVMAVSAVAPPPVLLQMLLYTGPILYIGSHASLKQNEVDAVTGQKLNKGESMNRMDAMLFPVFGSAALFSLYLAYKFLGAGWVNMLLTIYLSGVGFLALGETIFDAVHPLCPAFLSSDDFFVLRLWGPLIPIRRWLVGSPSTPATKPQEEQQQQQEPQQEQQQEETVQMQEKTDCSVGFSVAWLASYLAAFVVCALWLLTKHWALHNILAIAFCIQAIALVSVGSFGIASILLCGLFVYDVFWVFGTEVMVSVAKAFEGPAKLMFPVQLSPFQYSILGLGDVVIPGVFISMCLRFDAFLAQQQTTQAAQSTSVDIHQRFPKFYFWVVLVFYELGLLTTGIVMIAVQHPQPALLYLVPYCLFSLFGAAALNGKVKDVLAYSEEESVSSSAASAEKTEKKEN